MLAKAEQVVEGIITPPLEAVLTLVREFSSTKAAGRLARSTKEERMSSSFRCPICERVFKSAGGARRHMSSKHADVPKDERPTPIEVVEEPALEDASAAESATEKVTEETPPETTPSKPSPAEIPVGSTLLLRGGPFWFRPAPTDAWVGSGAEELYVSVESKDASTGVVNLLCRAQDAQGLWGILEEDVLSGKVQLVELAQSPVPPEEVEKANAEELRKAQAEARYVCAEEVSQYAALRDILSSAEKKFEAYKSKARESIMQCIRKQGSQNGTDSGPSLELDGYVAQIAVVSGATVVERDSATIVEWLLANGHDEYLTMSFDARKWEQLKLATSDSGEAIVPVEFIQKVEKSVTSDDKERLLISRMPD